MSLRIGLMSDECKTWFTITDIINADIVVEIRVMSVLVAYRLSTGSCCAIFSFDFSG